MIRDIAGDHVIDFAAINTSRIAVKIIKRERYISVKMLVSFAG